MVNRCEKLKGYSYFIYLINDYVKKGIKPHEAVKKAAEQCIKENILADYLEKNMSEVFNILTTEWDYEEELEVFGEEKKEEGKREEKMEIAKNLLGKLPVEEIANVTGLSIEEVEKLKEE